MSAQNPQDTSLAANKTAAEVAKEEEEKQKRLAGVWDAVKHDQPDENLDLLIDESLNEPDIKAGLERTNLDVDYLRAEIKQKDRGHIWEVVTGELQDLKEGVEALAQARTALESLLKTEPSALGPEKESTLGGCLLALGGAGVFVAIVGIVVVIYKNGWRPAFSLVVGQYRYWAIAIIVTTVLSYVLSFWLSGKRSQQYQRLRLDRDLAISGWRQSPELVAARKVAESAEARVVGLKAAIIKGILEKHLNNRFRTVINTLTHPSFDHRLNITSARGLAEVFDPKSAIDTSARNKLKFMLENMPGGSIGIAGPRGAGKSTLLRLFCGPKRILTTLKDKKVLAVLVSAPVAYQPRDFILYLFSTICQNALEAEGEEYPRPTLEQTREAATPSIAPFINLIEPLPKLCIYLGTTLAILALLFGLLLTVLPAASKEKGADSASPNTTAQTNPNAGAPANPQPSPQPTVQASPAPTPSPSKADRFFGDYLRAMEISPGSLLLWGTILIGVGMLFAAVVGKKPVRTLGLSWLRMLSLFPPINQIAKDVIRRMDAREDRLPAEATPTSSETPKPSPRTVKSEARDWLKRIKFQQSYTSGWSGSLKLPVGLEGGVNNAVTLAENQLSLPEISHAFTKFVELASQDYQVIIGIDELDKLEADKDAAHLFLNDIKSVFGLEKCFYLVSVSENAMSSFERRGLPFRDVFDSSFDDIIYVDYLDFESAQRLLEKKVIGRPIPFFGLSYTLSAGLARDLIRNFRAVMEFRQAKPAANDLEAIGRAIVHADLKAKIRATAVSAKQVELETEVDVFLERLYKLENAFQDESALFDASLALISGSSPVEDQDLDKEEEANREKLSELAEELATYVFFAVTVLEFFNNGLKETALTTPGPGGTLDDLARARQVLAVNLSTTRSILTAFRLAQKLQPRTWRHGPPVVATKRPTKARRGSRS